MGTKGDIAIHGRPLENLAKHRFLALGPVRMGGLPCLDLPERRPKGECYHMINRGNARVCLEYNLGPRGWQPPSFGHTGKVITENCPDHPSCDQY